jgi:hypothetical protein
MKLKPIDSPWRALQNIFWLRQDRGENLSAYRRKVTAAAGTFEIGAVSAVFFGKGLVRF